MSSAGIIKTKIMDQNTRASHPGLAPINDTLLTRESWKIFQIMAEFVEGFERLARIKPSVSIFGSARVLPDNPHYKLAEEIARGLCGRQRRWARPHGGGQQGRFRRQVAERGFEYSTAI